jgi:hypothetical protein
MADTIQSISRRDVLKNIALGGASLLYSPTVYGCHRQKKDKIGVAW